MPSKSSQSPAFARLKSSGKASTAGVHPSEVKPVEPLRKRQGDGQGGVLWKTEGEMSKIARDGFGMVEKGKK